MKKTTAGIKSRGIRFGFVLAGMMVASVAQAGDFVFGSKELIVNDAAGSSLLTNGTHVLAGNARGVSGNVINGVAFDVWEKDIIDISGSGVNLHLSGTSVGSGFKDEAVALYTLNAAWGSVLRSSYESSSYGVGNLLLSFTGLTIGQAYQLQGLYWDDGKTIVVRNPDNTNNVITYETEVPKSGAYWTATWTADATSKNIEIIPGYRCTIAGVSLRTFVPVDPYVEWISQFPSAGSETNQVDNPDGDSLDNLYEWALGGDPTNSADIGHVPTYELIEDGGTNWFQYTHVKLINAPGYGLTYNVEQSTDLTSGVWTNSGIVVYSYVWDADFRTVINRVNMDAEDAQFLRFSIERD